MSADIRAQATAAAMLTRRGTALTLARGGVPYRMTGVVLPMAKRGPETGSLTVGEAVTLYLTPVGATQTPQDGDTVTWRAREFTLRAVESLSPQGAVDVLYTAEATR